MGQGLTAEKMKEFVWIKPEAAARVDFLEWTGADHLRHTKFFAMRDDKDPSKVVRGTWIALPASRAIGSAEGL
jgi:ATP-dependent DNA ligase